MHHTVEDILSGWPTELRESTAAGPGSPSAT